MKKIYGWGPAGWTFLHAVSYTMPNKPTSAQRKQYNAFFERVGDVLPCPKCSKHYKNFWNKSKPDCSSKEKTINWLIDLHNDVNKRNGKPVMDRKEVDEMYNISPTLQPVQNKSSSPEDSTSGWQPWLIALVSILAAAALGLIIWGATKRKKK